MPVRLFFALAVVGGTVLAGCSSSPGADAQTAPASGVPNAEPEWQWVISAGSGRFDGEVLVPDDVSEDVTAYTERPDRQAYITSAAGFISEWAGIFQDDPPNLILTGRPSGGAGSSLGTDVVIVTATGSPDLRDGGRLSLPVIVIDTGVDVAGLSLVDVNLTVDGAVMRPISGDGGTGGVIFGNGGNGGSG